MADAPTTTEITQYKKNVVVLPTAYLKDRGSANLRMFLRKENSGTIFFIGNDPTNNALKLPYNVPCHNNKLGNTTIAATAAAGANVPAPIIANSQLNATGHYNRAAPIDVTDNTEAVAGTIGAAANTTGYNNIRNFCPDLRCVANEPTATQNNHKITNSGDHTSNFRIYLPNYEDDSQLEGCNFEFIIVCNNSQLESDKQLANLAANFPNADRASDFFGTFGLLGVGAPRQKQIAELGGIYQNDRPDSIGSANIEIISHSYITQMYESFAKEKDFHEAFPIPCKFTPYTDDPLTTKAYIHQLCNDDNYAKPDLYGFSPKFNAATHQPDTLTSLKNKIDGLGITGKYDNKYGIHADFRTTNDGNRSIYDRLNTQGKRILNKKIAGINHNGNDYTLSKFFNIYKNALNDTTNRDPVFTGDTDYNTPGVNNDVKTAMNFKENPKITNSALSTADATKDNFLNRNGAGRGVVDKRNIFADNVTTSYEPDLPCYGIDINPEEKHLSHRQANMVGTIHCRGSKAFSNNPDNIFDAAANPNPIMGDIAGPEVKDGLNPIIPVYNTLRHDDKGTAMQSGLGTPCDGEKPFHTIHINLNRLKYPAPNGAGNNTQPTGVSNLVGDVTVATAGAFNANTLKKILNKIPQMDAVGTDNNNNYNSVSNTAATANEPKDLLKKAYPNKYDVQDGGGGNAHEPLYNDGNPASLFGLHSKDTGRGYFDPTAAAAAINTRSPAPPLHHPFMRPFGTAGGGAGNGDPFTDALEQQDATAVGGTHDLATPDIITTQQKTYADHRQSCVNKQIHIKCNYLDGQWHVEVITPNVHTLGGNQLLHQNPGFRDITFVRGRK